MTLAFHIRDRYVAVMLFDLVRRLSVTLLILSLSLGPAVNSVHASSMGAKMAVTALSDMHSPGKCSDCAGSKNGVAPGVCSVYCTGVTAASPDVTEIDFLSIETFGRLATRLMAGLPVAPDPYPPRPTVLS